MVYFCISLLSSFLCFSDLSPYKQDIIRFCFLFKSSLSLTAFCSVVVSIISTIFGGSQPLSHNSFPLIPVCSASVSLLKYSLLFYLVCVREIREI